MAKIMKKPIIRENIPFINVEVPMQIVDKGMDNSNLLTKQQSAIISIIQQCFWPPQKTLTSSIRLKPFPNGITNLVILAENMETNERLVFRIFGIGTEAFIDRQKELETAILLSNVGIGAAPLATFCNGVVTEYLPGNPLRPTEIRKPAICQKIAEQMAKMHKCTPAIILASNDSVNYENVARKETASFVKITKWLDELMTTNNDEAKMESKANKTTINGIGNKFHKEEILKLCQIFDELSAKIVSFKLPIVFSHNDLLGYNILFDSAQQCVHFIDYEYAGINFQLNDFGNLFWEYSEDAKCATDEEIGMYLRCYFQHFDGQPPSEDKLAQSIHQVRCFEALTHLFWCIWALRQSQQSTLDFDYLTYARMRQRRLEAALEKCGQMSKINNSNQFSTTFSYPPMRYLSTRSGAPALGFCDVLLNGLAPDGGLYVPSFYPKFSMAQLESFQGIPYNELAFAIMAPFIGSDQKDLDLGNFKKMIDQVYSAPSPFDHSAICPLVQIGPNKFLLELFHGPTLAFKDFAMQLLARQMDHVLARRGLRATVIGATSGDTGGAAIHAFASLSSVNTFILFPEGRVSDFQRRQMTTPRAENIHAVSIDGTFDDCQKLVKEMFADEKLQKELALTSVNSINWARILAQVVYYFYAALAIGAPHRRVDFVVPTGNFGNIFAGYVAKQMGLPIGRLIIATNENDILARTLATGIYAIRPVRPTQSPSMDIVVSSNFERLLFEASGRNSEQIHRAYSSLRAKDEFVIETDTLQRILADFGFGSATETETSETIAQIYANCGGYMADPHTAVGIKVAAEIMEKGELKNTQKPKACVILSTAHPAKFPDAVMSACAGQSPKIPAKMEGILTAKELSTKMPNCLKSLCAFVVEKSKRQIQKQ